jgi:DNA-directed RNA polymerase I and III subunit RPAC2
MSFATELSPKKIEVVSKLIESIFAFSRLWFSSLSRWTLQNSSFLSWIPHPQHASADRTQATIKLFNETHTIGNALRHILARNPQVDFVGYSVPHPGEPYLNVRLQTRGTPVEEMLMDSLSTLGDICDHISETFDAEFAKLNTMED